MKFYTLPGILLGLLCKLGLVLKPEVDQQENSLNDYKNRVRDKVENVNVNQLFVWYDAFTVSKSSSYAIDSIDQDDIEKDSQHDIIQDIDEIEVTSVVQLALISFEQRLKEQPIVNRKPEEEKQQKDFHCSFVLCNKLSQRRNNFVELIQCFEYILIKVKITLSVIRLLMLGKCCIQLCPVYFVFSLAD